MTPEINHRRAAFVLGRIDEILSWEKTKEQEKDVSALWSWESISARFAPSSIGD